MNDLTWVTTIGNVGLTGVVLVMLIKGWGIVLARELADAQKLIQTLRDEKAADKAAYAVSLAEAKADKVKLELDCREERKEHERELRAVTELMVTQVVPLMTRAVDAEAELVEMMERTDRREERRDERDGGRRSGRDEPGPGPSRPARR